MRVAAEKGKKRITMGMQTQEQVLCEESTRKTFCRRIAQNNFCRPWHHRGSGAAARRWHGISVQTCSTMSKFSFKVTLLAALWSTQLFPKVHLSQQS